MVPRLATFPDVQNFAVRKPLAEGYAHAAGNVHEFWFQDQYDYRFYKARGWLEEATSRILPGEGVDTEYHQWEVCRVQLRALSFFLSSSF